MAVPCEDLILIDKAFVDEIDDFTISARLGHAGAAGNRQDVIRASMVATIFKVRCQIYSHPPYPTNPHPIGVPFFTF